MSFQAFLDNIETKTGKTPNEFIALSREKGFGADTKAGEIVFLAKRRFWLRTRTCNGNDARNKKWSKDQVISM